MNDKLSIVTGTLDRYQSLDRLITSIRKHTSVEWELIVGDASDLPIIPTSAMNPDNPSQVRIMVERPRLGHVKGYNCLFRQCRGEYVMWLNDDAEVLPGYDLRAINFLSSHPNIGLGCFYYREIGAINQHFHVNSCFNMIFANFGILSRSFGDSIGWFDEDFYMYGGDNSITFRTLLAGKGVAQIPGPSIIHHSDKDDLRIENEKHRKSDGEILSRKYSSHRREMQAVYARTRHLVGPKVLVM